MFRLKELFASVTLVAFLYSSNAYGFIVAKEDPALPKIYAEGPDYRIVRVQPNNEIKYVKCPEGTTFDKTSLTCGFLTRKLRNHSKLKTKKSGCDDKHGHPILGIAPDFRDCRYFYLCGPGTSARLPCQTGLLFNQDISNCDWPRNAQCCEFPGDNPLKLVVPQHEYLTENLI